MKTTSSIPALAIALVAPALAAAESVVVPEDLPLPVRTTIAEHAGGGVVERITSDDAQGTVVYTVRFRDAQDKTIHALRIGRDGRPLAEGPSTSEPPIGAPSTGVPLSAAPPEHGAAR